MGGTVEMISVLSEARLMSETREPSDERLVELASSGDLESFTVLADRYRVRAMRIAYGILHNRADAEDAVQEAFIRIYRSLGRFRGTGRFSTWLYRIVVNESLRVQSNRGSTEEVEPKHEAARSGVPNVQALIVRQCLASLPEKLRIVLALRGLEDLDYAEIGSILGIPVGTVRSRLHEARRLFAERWKELMKDED